MRKLDIILLSILIALGYCSCQASGMNKKMDTQRMLNYCLRKVVVTMNSLSDLDSLPRNILRGQKEWNTVSIHDWTSGFWPGILWYSWEESHDSTILNMARKYTAPLKEILNSPVGNHDLGFMLFNSFGNGYRLTSDPKYKEILLIAADSLATLFNPKVGTILSWPSMRQKMNWPHNTIIDNMMNLELLFWASKNGGSHDLYDMAVSHAEKCMTSLVRSDYSTFHVAVFDTIDGHFIKGVTHQGYQDSSLWARGQAWGIYGYTMCYRETGKEEFLDTAEELANVFIKRLPEDGIPYWDFEDQAIPNAPKDASAAAIAASGMLELSTFVKNEKASATYKKAAITLLTKLSTVRYLSEDTNQAMLLHSTGHKPVNSEVNASIIYADYYYLEALHRMKKMKK